MEEENVRKVETREFKNKEDGIAYIEEQIKELKTTIDGHKWESIVFIGKTTKSGICNCVIGDRENIGFLLFSFLVSMKDQSLDMFVHLLKTLGAFTEYLKNGGFPDDTKN
jgi:hypothetical protein